MIPIGKTLMGFLTETQSATYAKQPQQGDIIQFLRLLPFPGYDKPVSSSLPLVVVLVERRLINDDNLTSNSAGDLLGRLERFHDDLCEDGFDARFLETELAKPAGHRDGEGVLALRALLQDLHSQHQTLSGAILVGSFPEAMLVRRWIWRKGPEDVVINGVKHENVAWLRITPEIVATRSDVVLCDLTGNWDQLYCQGPTNLDSIRAIPDDNVPASWPVDGGLFGSSVFEHTTIPFQDFFWISDDDFEIVASPDPGFLLLRMFTQLRNPEISAGDLALPNPLARPDIVVSRINARNIAWSPKETFLGTDGSGLLDAQGKPEAITTATYCPSDWLWQPDSNFERRLLIDYFDRNHRARQGWVHNGYQCLTAGIATAGFTEWEANHYISQAGSSFGRPAVMEHATLLDFVQWLKIPAVLRGIWAHAYSQGTQWAEADNGVEALEAAVGGNPWRWRMEMVEEQADPGGAGGGDPWLWGIPGTSFKYEPSFDEQGRDSNFYVYRTMWENGVLSEDPPCFYIHTGCDANSPHNAPSTPYDNPYYADMQEAEGFLFYLNALAVVARAKVFNDWPREFPDELAKPSARFGDGLRAYFELDGNDANLGDPNQAPGNKRCYPWSILGDWTLRLTYEPAPHLKFKKPDLRVWPLPRQERWMVTDGFSPIIYTRDEAEAERCAEVLTHYRLTERFEVGTGEDAWEYYLADGQVPEGPLDGEQSLGIDPDKLAVNASGTGWVVAFNGRAIARAPSRQVAAAIVDVIRRLEATYACWVGDARRPAMRYVRR